MESSRNEINGRCLVVVVIKQVDYSEPDKRSEHAGWQPPVLAKAKQTYLLPEQSATITAVK